MGKREYYEDSRDEMKFFLTNSINRSIEFGCSNGNFSESVKLKCNAETWGVDIDEKAVKEAKGRMFKVLHGDAMEIINDLPEKYFDCLICNDFIEHIASPNLFFEKIRPCLTDDAILICSLPNVRYWKHLNRYLFLKDWKYKNSGILDYTHLRFFTKKSMKRSMKEWGFKIEVVKGIRPSKSPFFYLFNLLTIFYIWDMRYLQYGFRSKLQIPGK